MCKLLNPAEYQAKILGPLSEVTLAMERRGVPFDVPAAEARLAQVNRDLEATEAALTRWCADVDYVGPEVPPNWGSWQQLQLFLYTPLGLNLPPSLFWKKGRTGWHETEDGEYVEEISWRTGEGEYKTDDKALEWLGFRHPEHKPGLDLIRRHRWQLRVKAYLEKWIGLALWDPRRKWWFLHPSFGLASDRDTRPGAVTGRFAVKNPALQQVPAHDDEYRLRELFRAPPGWKWVVIDYSQLEIVVLAHITHRLFGSDGLVRRMAPGAPDMHSATAKYVFGEVLGDERIRLLDVGAIKKDPYGKDFRDLVKPIRYGLNYGKGARGFGDTLFMADGAALGEERAERIIEALFAFDPEIPQYQDWVRDFITRELRIVSLFGRTALLPDAASLQKGLRNRAWRRALNFPMQSGGQEITALGMVACHRDPVLRRLDCGQVLQVHDENCFLVPEAHAEEARERIIANMLNTVRLDAHLAASGGIADSWGEAK